MSIKQYEEGIRDLFIFMMINDKPSMYNTVQLQLLLKYLANELGYKNWVDAYHKL